MKKSLFCSNVLFLGLAFASNQPPQTSQLSQDVKTPFSPEEMPCDPSLAGLPEGPQCEAPVTEADTRSISSERAFLGSFIELGLGYNTGSLKAAGGDIGDAYPPALSLSNHRSRRQSGHRYFFGNSSWSPQSVSQKGFMGTLCFGYNVCLGKHFLIGMIAGGGLTSMAGNLTYSGNVTTLDALSGDILSSFPRDERCRFNTKGNFKASLRMGPKLHCVFPFFELGWSISCLKFRANTQNSYTWYKANTYWFNGLLLGFGSDFIVNKYATVGLSVNMALNGAKSAVIYGVTKALPFKLGSQIISPSLNTSNTTSPYVISETPFMYKQPNNMTVSKIKSKVKPYTINIMATIKCTFPLADDARY